MNWLYKIKYLLAASISCTMLSCTYDFPQVPPTPQTPGTDPNLSKMVVLGGSSAAGLMDGALFDEGQGASFGAILAKMVNQSVADSLIFRQPDINSSNGFNLREMDEQVVGKYIIEFLNPGNNEIFKVSTDGELPGEYTGSLALNNFSIPNLRTPQVIDPELAENPFYHRIASNPGTSILLDQVINANPSLIFLALGMDDILSYISNGLIGSLNPDPQNIQAVDLTPRSLFESAYDLIISSLLTDSGAEIILFNIPDFTQFPFFNHIGHLARITASQAGELNTFYGDYNITIGQFNTDGIIRSRIQFFSDDSFTTWITVVEDPALADIVLIDGTEFSKIRQMIEGESLLWSVPDFPQGLGPGTLEPVSKQFWVSEENLEVIRNLIDDFNTVVEQLVETDNRISLFDLNDFYRQLNENGAIFNGVTLTPDMGRSGIFSADGINLNQRGNALLANQVIQLLNIKFSLNIPLADVNEFKGNTFRNGF